MYRKQEWDSPSRLSFVPRVSPPRNLLCVKTKGQSLTSEAVPPQPAAKARTRLLKPNPAETAPVGTKQPQRYSRRRLALGPA